MNHSGYLILLISLLVCPVFGVETFNWVNATSDNGIYFEIPPYWAWDPIDQTTVAIRSEKSDVVLQVSSLSRIPGSADVTGDAQQQLTDLHVTTVNNLSYDNKTVTASGTTKNGMIINLTETFEGNHTFRWISGYADNDAILKYADTISTIIRSTRFNQTSE